MTTNKIPFTISNHIYFWYFPNPIKFWIFITNNEILKQNIARIGSKNIKNKEANPQENIEIIFMEFESFWSFFAWDIVIDWLKPNLEIIETVPAIAIKYVKLPYDDGSKKNANKR